MIRVAVLAGGPSSEREISLKTGEAVMEHLPRDRVEPYRVEILPDRSWSVDGGEPVSAEVAAAELRRRDTRVVFPALHGPFGEDGTLQGFLETVGLAYVGSGVAASAIAMDKARAREVAVARGLSVPEGIEVSGDPWAGVERVLAAVGPPVVVKAPVGGSSLEVVVATDRVTLTAAVERLLGRPGGRAVVEHRIAGDEVTCAVLGNASTGAPLSALPPVLIRPRGEWFDYAAKYDPAAAEEICPAPLDEGVLARVAALALEMHAAIRADGLTRSDFIVPEDDEPRFLEINTLPGLTEASICPKAARAAGIPFPELLHRLVTMALDRERVRRGGRP